MIKNRNNAFNYLILILIFNMISCGGGSTISQTKVDDSEEPQDVYFANVFSIITNNCSTCHNKPPQNGAPMSLISYEDIYFNANSILNRLKLDEKDSLSMPKDLPSLSQEDIKTIEDWVNAGRPNN